MLIQHESYDKYYRLLKFVKFYFVYMYNNEMKIKKLFNINCIALVDVEKGENYFYKSFCNNCCAV